MKMGWDSKLNTCQDSVSSQSFSKLSFLSVRNSLLNNRASSNDAMISSSQTIEMIITSKIYSRMIPYLMVIKARPAIAAGKPDASVKRNPLCTRSAGGNTGATQTKDNDISK